MSLRSEVVRIFNELLAGSKKISELTSLPSNVQNTDLIEVVRSGQNYKALGSQLPSGGGGSGDLQDVLDAGSTAVAPTDISIDAGAGTQFFIGENTGFAQMNLHGSAMNLFADTGLTVENGAAGSFGINTTQPININADGGTAGQVLTSNGAGAPPTWENGGGGAGDLDDVLAAGGVLSTDRTINTDGNTLETLSTTSGNDRSFSRVSSTSNTIGYVKGDDSQQASVSVSDAGIVVEDTWTSRGLQGDADFSANLQSNDYAQYNLIVATDTTGTAISFAKPQIYGSDASPETGNITIVTTGLVKGMTQLLIHNNGSEPTYGSPIKIISGAYVTGELNYIMLLAVSTTSVLVTISQEV